MIEPMSAKTRTEGRMIEPMSYHSKTFTDFTHSISEIISGMCNNGIVITGLHEFDYDISGGFGNISKQGFPLSMIIEGKRSV